MTEELRVEFGKLYPNDLVILDIAKSTGDYGLRTIGARHHWKAFEAGARAAERLRSHTELLCDDCRTPTDNPWHSSTSTNRHYHRCDVCHSKNQIFEALK